MVGLKAVNSAELAGVGVGAGAGTVGLGEAAAPEGAASLLTRTSSPPGKACLSSVLKVPEAGSKTNSVEKLGLAASSCAAGAGSSKLMAGLLRVKLSSSESKSKADGRGAGAMGDGRGV